MAWGLRLPRLPPDVLAHSGGEWFRPDAARCALNGWAYWTLRKAGESVAAATRALHETGVGEKNELLFRHGITFNDTPQWQRRGVGLYWEQYEKVGYDPVRQVEVPASRRRVKVDRELPMKDEYGALVGRLLGAGSVAPT